MIIPHLPNYGEEDTKALNPKLQLAFTEVVFNSFCFDRLFVFGPIHLLMRLKLKKKTKKKQGKKTKQKRQKKNKDCVEINIHAEKGTTI